MFRRARVRLTLLYIGLFALVLGIFSGVFYTPRPRFESWLPYQFHGDK
jgi:hypothetical protein